MTTSAAQPRRAVEAAIPEISTWRMAVAGLCAALISIGIGRFAYTPLIPVLIAERWFAPSDVVYLGAANLAGYLLGALVARPAAKWVSATALVRVAMLLATAACFACAVPVSLSWYFVWRLIAGVNGGIVMVLAASVILPHTSPQRRGIISGVIFAGVGLGVAASGTLVPLLLRFGPVATWYGLGALSGLLTVVSWANWPRSAGRPRGREVLPAASGREPLPVRALVIEYGLNAVALVPHMVFLVDFVARGLGRGLGAGSGYWVLYGIGAALGPLTNGYLADRIGFGRALRLAFLVQAGMIAIPAVTAAPAALALSSFIVGACTPGIVPLALGRVHELIPGDPDRQRAYWSRVTASYALFQAGAAYGFSYLFTQTGGQYGLLFGLGSLAVLLALVLDIGVSATKRGRP